MASKSRTSIRTPSRSFSVGVPIALVTLCSIAVTPFSSFDPINQVKMLVIAAAGISALPLIFQATTNIRAKSFELTLLVSLFMLVVTFLLSIVMNNLNPATEIYGTFGRNTGLLTYISLIFIFIGLALAKVENLTNLALGGLLFSGFLNFSYGIVQYMGLDPIDWNVIYNPIMGFLGNPNFFSAFMAIFSGAIIGLLLFPAKYKVFNTVVLISLLTGIFLVSLYSESWQGPAIMFFLLVLAATIKIARIFKGATVVLSATLTLIGFVAVVITGFFGKGPLGDFLSKYTLKIRIEYWKVAIDSIKENPWFGTGFDSFAHQFRLFRSDETTSVIGETTFTNSAHNVYLDFAVNVGLPALFLLICLKIFTLILVFKYFKHAKSLEPQSVAVILAWLGYEIQAMVSINQIGLAAWGYLLNGIVVCNLKNLAVPTSSDRGVSSKQEIKKMTIVSVVFALLGFLAAWPSYRNDVSFRNALNKGDLNVALASVTKWPTDAERLRFLTVMVAEQGFQQQSKDLSDFAFSKYPYDYGIVSTRSILEAVPEEEKETAREILKQIDPLSLRD